MQALPNPTLHVSAPELAEQLKPFALAQVLGDALVSFDGSELCVSLGGVTTRITATGNWPGVARIPGRFWVPFARWLRDRERVVLQITSQRRFIVQDGSASIDEECSWHDETVTRIDVPLGARVVDWLAIAEHHRDPELTAAGILPDVTEARRVRDECFAEAVAILSPLGIDEADLRELLSRKLRG